MQDAMTYFMDDDSSSDDWEDSPSQNTMKRQHHVQKEPTFEEMLQSYPFDHKHKFAGASQETAGLPNKRKHKQNPSPISLDLHGMTVSEAQNYLKSEIHSLLIQHKQINPENHYRQRRHSEYGPVLADASHQYIREQYGKYIRSIEASPTESTINRIAVRGYLWWCFHDQSHSIFQTKVPLKF